MRRLVFLLVGSVAALGLWLSSAAFARGQGTSSGEITTAEASGDWTTGHLVGWASWTGCGSVESSEPLSPWLGNPEPVPCEWQPFATVGPGATEADCEEASRLPWSSGEGASVVWVGHEVSTSGTQHFDLLETPLYGTPGELACLGFVETNYNTCLWESGKICAQWYSSSRVSLLDAALLTTASGAPEGGEEEAEEPGEIEEPEESVTVEIEESNSGEGGIVSPPEEALGVSPPSTSQPQSYTAPPGRCRKGQRRVHRAGHVFCKYQNKRHNRHRHKRASKLTLP